jgi:uncharacterized tellurite resistance protein B-like protein
MARIRLHSAEFYSHLAHLFYAVALADKTITRKEKEEIIRLVDVYWTSDSNSINGKEIIYTHLRQLIANKVECTAAYDSFKNYYIKNLNSFDAPLREKIMDSAYDIANATAKRNKSELTFLNRLHRLLFNT